MTRVAAACGLVLAGCAVGSAAPLPGTRAMHGHQPTPVHRIAVFGSDERRLLDAGRRDLHEAIGLLHDDASRQVCTAFCVARDIVATAAHCVHGSVGRPVPSLSSLTFRHSLRDPRARARIAGARQGNASQHVMSGSMHLSVRPPIDATRDWALLRLDRPACGGAQLRLGEQTPAEVSELAAAGRLYQVGFHRDFASWQLAISRPCEAALSYDSADRSTIERDFEDAESLVLHTCDTGGASSGSPLLVDGPDGPEVVAINVGTYVLSRVMMSNGAIVKRFRTDTIANTALSASVVKSMLPAIRSAGILADRQAIMELQRELLRKGIDPGSIDGTYGPQTRAAIETYEARAGLPVTGLATRALVHLLRRATTTTDAGTRSPTTTRSD